MEIHSTCMSLGLLEEVQFLIHTNPSQLLSLIPGFLVLTTALEFPICQTPTTLSTLVHEAYLSLSSLHCSSASYYVASLSKISYVIARYFSGVVQHFLQKKTKKKHTKRQDFPGGTVVKNPPANAGNTGSIPGPGRSHMLRSS